MLALSVSISTSSSPLETSSPSDLSHLRIVPSSMESDRRGMATPDIAARLRHRHLVCPLDRRRPGAAREPDRDRRLLDAAGLGLADAEALGMAALPAELFERAPRSGSWPSSSTSAADDQNSARTASMIWGSCGY